MNARSRESELAVKTFTPDLYPFAFWLARVAESRRSTNRTVGRRPAADQAMDQVIS